jgi:hypothetical protein
MPWSPAHNGLEQVHVRTVFMIALHYQGILRVVKRRTEGQVNIFTIVIII